MSKFKKEIKFVDSCLSPYSEIRMEQGDVGIIGLMSVRDGSDIEMYTIEDFERVLNLENFDNEYHVGFITDNHVLYSPYMLDQFGDQHLGINVYDQEGSLQEDINVDDSLGYAKDIHGELDYIYFSNDDGSTGFIEMTTGGVIKNSTLPVSHGNLATMLQGTGIVCMKTVNNESIMVLLDFDFNTIWEQTVDPHPQISGSIAITNLRVDTTHSYIFATVHIGNNDAVMAKFDITDGSLLSQVSLDTKAGQGEGEAIWLDSNNKIYVSSRRDASNGEDWVVEIINPDMTFHKKLTMTNRTLDGYDGEGEPFVITGHSIEPLIDNTVLFAGYYSGTSPSAGFWAYYDITTEEINVLDDHIYDYQFLDEIVITKGRPYYWKDSGVTV